MTSGNAPEWSGGGEEKQDPSKVAIDEESWAPSSEWVDEWKKKLPLQTVMRVIHILTEVLCFGIAYTLSPCFFSTFSRAYHYPTPVSIGRWRK